MICITCGTTKQKENGYCINDHDNWFEWDDLFYDTLYLELFERLKDKLDISNSEIVVKLYSSNNYILNENKAIKQIFSREFVLGD